MSGHVLVELVQDPKDDNLKDLHDKTIADTVSALLITAGYIEQLISPQHANEQRPMAIVRTLHTVAHQVRQHIQSLLILHQQYYQKSGDAVWPDVYQLPTRGFESRPLAYRKVAGKDQSS